MRKYLLLLLILCVAFAVQAQDSQRVQDANAFNPDSHLDKTMPNIWADRVMSVKWYNSGIDNQLTPGDVYGLITLMKQNFSELATELDWFLDQWPQASEVYAINPDGSDTIYETASVGGSYYINAYGKLVAEPSTDYSGDLTATSTTQKYDHVHGYYNMDEAEGLAYVKSQVPGANNYKVFYGRDSISSNIYTPTAEVTIGGTVYKLEDAQVHSPIVLDLDGDGKLQASNGKWLPHSYSESRGKLVQFDVNGDDFLELTEWVGPNDGLLLVYEGKEVNGTHLFGDVDGFLSGYEKLSLLDKNNDKKISGKELATLSVWQDKNSNAKVEDGEITLVADLGITAISLNHKNFVSTFVQNGKTKLVWDWYPSSYNVKQRK